MLVPVIPLAEENDPVDASSLVVGHVKRPIGPLAHANGAMLRGCRERASGSGEAVSECHRGTRRPSVATERNELHLESLVRLRRAIEAAVERDEQATAVAPRELVAAVEQHSVRRPVRAEGAERLIITCAIDPLRTGHAVAIPTVLGREHLLVLGDRVEVAVWPAVVASSEHARELLGGKVRTLILRIELRPVLEEHVPALLHGVQLAI